MRCPAVLEVSRVEYQVRLNFTFRFQEELNLSYVQGENIMASAN
jgi:hypothetical protein